MMSLLKRLLLTNPPMSVGPAYDAFRRSHDIEGSDAGEQTDYQVKVKVHYDFDVLQVGGAKVSNPVIAGTWREISNMLYDPDDVGKEYKVYLCHHSTRDIYYAHSADGVSWSAPAKVIDEAWQVEDAYVIKVGATYYLFCEHFVADVNTIDRYTSADGETWANRVQVLSGDVGEWDEGTTASPTVWKEGDTWYMLYEGMDDPHTWGKMGLATSPDGLNWTKEPTNPVMEGVGGEWDANWFSPDDIWKIGSTYYMCYHAADVGGTYRTGLATTPDFINWTRHGGNPIVYSDYADPYDAINNAQVLPEGTDFTCLYNEAGGAIWRGYLYKGPEVNLEGNCRTDFGDLRFRQGVTELDYYMEEKVDSDYAIFWVKVNSIPQIHPKIESGTWMVNGETYNNRIKIVVNENSGGNLTDYQVKVTFNTKYFVDNGYATAVGDEVRFTDSDGSTLLDFWRETAFDDEETVYWVEVPSLLASEERNLYIYFDADLGAVPSGSTDFREDFTGYTEVDPNNHWEQITRRNTGSGVLKSEDSYVWKDYGADNFGDFEHRLTIYTTSIDDFAWAGLWAACNVLGSRLDSDGLYLDMSRHDAGLGRAISIRSVAEAGLDQYTPFSLTTPYYLTIRRYGTSFTCLIYSDAERTVLLDTLSLVVATTEYRYLQIGFSSESGAAEVWSGYCESLHLREYVEPEPSVTVETLGEATIYVYYGKADATSESDGKATFPVFDDFDDNEIDTDLWTEGGAGETGSVTEANERIEILLESNGADWISRYMVVDAAQTVGICIRCFIDWNGEVTTSNGANLTLSETSDAPFVADALRIIFSAGAVLKQLMLQTMDAGGADTIKQEEITTYEGVLELCITATHVKGILDGEIWQDWTAHGLTLSANLYAYLGKSSKSATSTTSYFNDFWIRKCVNPEPTNGAWGSEEAVVWPF